MHCKLHRAPCKQHQDQPSLQPAALRPAHQRSAPTFHHAPHRAAIHQLSVQGVQVHRLCRGVQRKDGASGGKGHAVKGAHRRRLRQQRCQRLSALAVGQLGGCGAHRGRCAREHRLLQRAAHVQGARHRARHRLGRWPQAQAGAQRVHLHPRHAGRQPVLPRAGVQVQRACGRAGEWMMAASQARAPSGNKQAHQGHKPGRAIQLHSPAAWVNVMQPSIQPSCAAPAHL